MLSVALGRGLGLIVQQDHIVLLGFQKRIRVGTLPEVRFESFFLNSLYNAQAGETVGGDAVGGETVGGDAVGGDAVGAEGRYWGLSEMEFT